MFNFSLTELFVIFPVALIVLGPKRLPEIARTLGKVIAELQRSLQGVKEQMDSGIKRTDHAEETLPKPENKNTEAGPDKSHTFGGSDTQHAQDSAGGTQRDTSNKEHS